jgi:hypothetical protein
MLEVGEEASVSVLFVVANSQRCIIGVASVLMNKPGATISAWVRPASLPGGGMSILSYAIGPPPAVNSSMRFTLQVNATGQLVMQARSTDGDTTRTFTGTAALPIGAWSHVAGTCHYGTSFGRTYINGAIDNSGQFSGNFAASTTSNTISKSGALSGNGYGDAPQWDGLMEDVRCYGRDLGPHEIQTMFAARGTDGLVDDLEARYPLVELADGLAVMRVADISEKGLSAPGTNGPVYDTTITRSFRRATRRTR